jgi:hypothetical protein
MKTIFIAVIALLAFQCRPPGHKNPEKNIRKITGWTLEGKDTLIAVLIKYDSLGRKTLDAQPWYYCSTEFEYDPQGRVIIEDHMCGESSGNGVTTYSYTQRQRYSRFAGGAYEDEEKTTYNRKGLPVEKWGKHLRYKTESEPETAVFMQTHFSYYYDNKKRLICYTEASVSYEQEKNGPKSPERKENIYKYYSYTDFDSVISYIELDPLGRSECRYLREYDEKSHLCTREYRFRNDVVSRFGSPSPDNIGYQSTVYFYERNKLLRTEIREHCGKEEKITGITDFKNGLPESEVTYDCEGKMINEIKYKVEYWP